jgi:fusaric acid resistance family protein
LLDGSAAHGLPASLDASVTASLSNQPFIDAEPPLSEVNIAGVGSFLPKTVSRFRYASDILLGTTLLWFLFRYLGDTNPVWAIISFTVVTDPNIERTQPTFLSRSTDTLIGCVAGIVFVLIFGAVDWMFPIALTLTALVCPLLICRSIKLEVSDGYRCPRRYLCNRESFQFGRYRTGSQKNSRGRCRQLDSSAHFLALCALWPKESTIPHVEEKTTETSTLGVEDKR